MSRQIASIAALLIDRPHRVPHWDLHSSMLRHSSNYRPQIADGSLSLDVTTRDYIRANLGFRWIMMESGKAAFELQRRFQRAEAACGEPLLNPL
jgi:hypothetical protein